jgi:hypothetical protein
MFHAPRPATSAAEERYDTVDRVVIRPLDEEVRAAVLWALPLGVLRPPARVCLLDLAR